MKKILLLSMLLLAATFTLKAQTSYRFGYSESINNYLGTQTAETYDCAIYIPKRFAGLTIDSVHFFLYDKSVVKNVSGWVSKTLPLTGSQATKNVKIDDALLLNYSEGSCSVGFDEPLVIPEEGCYAGYSFTVTKTTTTQGKYPVLTDSDNETDGGFFLRTSTNQRTWGNMYSQGFGNLVVFADIKGDFPKNAVSIAGELNSIRGAKNSTVNTELTICNTGTEPLTSLSYRVDGIEGDEKTISLPAALEFQKEATVSLPVSLGSNIGKGDLTLTLTKANGQENKSAFSNASVETFVLSKLAPRKVLEEEYTGTTCGYCPRGIVGMDECKNQIGDKWIGVALHLYATSDPMYQSSLYSLKGYFPSGAPDCVVNRGPEADPYVGITNQELGIIDYCNSLASVAPLASLSVEAAWNSADSLSIDVRSHTTLLYSEDEDRYALAYYVIADSMSGTTTAWRQTNYYYQQSKTNGSYLNDWCGGGKYGVKSVAGISFNHVALAGFGVESGLTNSLSAPFKADETQTHEMTANLASNKFFSADMYKKNINKKNVSVVAFILDTKTGEVINAAECHVKGYDPVGISSVEAGDSNPTEIARYNLAGQRIFSPQKGVNVIRLSNGKTVKVLVK